MDALALTQSIESAEGDAKKLGGPASLQQVHHMQKGVKPASSLTSPNMLPLWQFSLGSCLSTHREGVQALQKERLMLLQRATLKPLVPHQIRSPLRGHTMSKSSQNKRIILAGMNTALMPFMMNILHSPSPSTSTTLQSRWKSTWERQFSSSMRPPSNEYSSPHVPPPGNQSVAS